MKRKKCYTPAVAQEVEKAAKELNYDFGGGRSEEWSWFVRFHCSDFVVPLVNSAELSQQNDDLKKRLEKVEAILNARQSTETSNLQTANLNSSSLEQNTPNPFNANTTIDITCRWIMRMLISIFITITVPS